MLARGIPAKRDFRRMTARPARGLRVEKADSRRPWMVDGGSTDAWLDLAVASTCFVESFRLPGGPIVRGRIQMQAARFRGPLLLQELAECLIPLMTDLPASRRPFQGGQAQAGQASRARHAPYACGRPLPSERSTAHSERDLPDARCRVIRRRGAAHQSRALKHDRECARERLRFGRNHERERLPTVRGGPQRRPNQTWTIAIHPDRRGKGWAGRIYSAEVPGSSYGRYRRNRKRSGRVQKSAGSTQFARKSH